MARVFLLNPPSPEPVRTPLLSFCHLASSLRAGGHQVALLDASAPFAPRETAQIVARLQAFAPDLVGLHCKTLHIQPAYALAAELQKAGAWPLVAGGPHATVRPDEPFDHGFRYVVRGEGEETLVELADAIDGKRAFSEVLGLGWVTDDGKFRLNPARGFLRELDALAPPLEALDLFDPAWYGHAVELPPGGLLSSRGCPAACTFCSNDVTGRQYRYRSPASVVSELGMLKARYGSLAVNFYDDSFAVGRRRMRELCEALAQPEVQPLYWTCTAHPSHLDHDILADMKRAGCGGIDIGMESGDPEMLLRIGKGVKVERVVDVLGWGRELGLHMVVNLMFGWPDETDAELDATVDFMTRVASVAGGFNARGVVVPYPATQVYEQNHRRFGFTDWWLREAPLDYPAFPTSWDASEILRCYAADPALDRNFFQHPPSRVARIRAALHQKAELTLGVVARQQRQDFSTMVPAAGAR